MRFGAPAGTSIRFPSAATGTLLPKTEEQKSVPSRARNISSDVAQRREVATVILETGGENPDNDPCALMLSNDYTARHRQARIVVRNKLGCRGMRQRKALSPAVSIGVYASAQTGVSCQCNFGEPVYEYTLVQAQEDGYLAACEIVKRKATIDADRKSVV